MSNKHTPGPWISMHEEHDPKTKWDIDIRNSKPYAHEDSKLIASAHTPFVGSEIAIANAKLIAAAPELLEATEALLVIAEFFHDVNKKNKIGRVIESAKAAIRKATE